MREYALDQQIDVRQDFVRRPLNALVLWWLPIGVGMLQSALGLPYWISCTIWAVAFAWMGMGCLINAYRCHRLHCYISGPIFLIGSLTSGLLALDVIESGPHALNYIVAVIFALVMLSFSPELAWGKYV